ncbi:MAG: hypothetical protein ACM4AI_21150, partial [Acidobacteriota bacterium]
GATGPLQADASTSATIASVIRAGMRIKDFSRGFGLTVALMAARLAIRQSSFNESLGAVGDRLHAIAVVTRSLMTTPDEESLQNCWFFLNSDRA